MENYFFAYLILLLDGVCVCVFTFLVLRFYLGSI